MKRLSSTTLRLAVAPESGADATTYSLVPSVTQVKRKADGTHLPEYVSCESIFKTGNSAPVKGIGTIKFLFVYKTGSISQEFIYSSRIIVSADIASISFRLYIGSVLVDSKAVVVVDDGIKGDSGLPGPAGQKGQLVCPAGFWLNNVTYTATKDYTPLVYYEAGKTYYVLNKLGDYVGINPADDYAVNGVNATWIPFQNYKAIFAEMMMVNFGKLSSAVFYGEYMFSQQGIDINGNPTSNYSLFAPEKIGTSNCPFTPNILINFLTGKIISLELDARGGQIGGLRIDELKGISLKVANMKVGGRNLILNSNQVYSGDSYKYNICEYAQSIDCKTGETYTLTVNYKNTGAGAVGIWINSSSYYGCFPLSTQAVTNSITFKAVEDGRITLYHRPSGSSGVSTVNWAVLTEGNISNASWFPAPEDKKVGGENLVLNGDFIDCEERGYGWNVSLNGVRNAKGWSDFNSGVPLPNLGYHAHIEDQSSCLVYALKNLNGLRYVGERPLWTNDADGYRKSPSTAHGTTSKEKVCFYTGANNQVVQVDMKVSSELNYDFIYMGNPDTALVIDSNYFARTSGTDPRTLKATIATAGEHYIEFGYIKDGSGFAGSDCGWYKVTIAPDNFSHRYLGISQEIKNFVKNIQAGDEYTISFDACADTVGYIFHGGMHLFANSWGFHDDIFRHTFTSADINKWIRVTKTFKSVGTTEIPRLYIYGDTGVQGSGWLKNVSLQKGNVGYWTKGTQDLASKKELEDTGIDIYNNRITLTADKTLIQANDGTPIAVFEMVNGKPQLTSSMINTDTLTAKKVQTTNPTTNSKVIIEGGVMSMFGTKGVANWRMGTEPDTGEAVLDYYDNSGAKIYSLGPKGINMIEQIKEGYEGIYYTKYIPPAHGNKLTANGIMNSKEFLWLYHAKRTAGILENPNFAIYDGKYFSFESSLSTNPNDTNPIYNPKTVARPDDPDLSLIKGQYIDIKSFSGNVNEMQHWDLYDFKNGVRGNSIGFVMTYP